MVIHDKYFLVIQYLCYYLIINRYNMGSTVKTGSQKDLTQLAIQLGVVSYPALE